MYMLATKDVYPIIIQARLPCIMCYTYRHRVDDFSISPFHLINFFLWIRSSQRTFLNYNYNYNPKFIRVTAVEVHLSFLWTPDEIIVMGVKYFRWAGFYCWIVWLTMFFFGIILDLKPTIHHCFRKIILK